MPVQVLFFKVRFVAAVPVVFVLLACQASTPPEFGMVDWYVANGDGSSISLNIYDKVCGKNHYRVRVPRSAEVPISTCANAEGQAEIRYSRASGYSVSENPVRHDVVSRNQSLLVN